MRTLEMKSDRFQVVGFDLSLLPNERTEPMSDLPQERQLLESTIADLGPLVEAGMPRRTPTAFAFAQAEFSDNDDYVPSLERMNKAIALYRAIPPSEQRRIQNGWVGDLIDRPTQAELCATLTECVNDVKRVLTITDSARGLIATQDWDLGRAAPVVLQIQFGTTKAQVLQSLRDITAAVCDHFSTLIVEEFSDIEKLDQAVSEKLGSLSDTSAG